jgi:flagellin
LKVTITVPVADCVEVHAQSRPARLLRAQIKTRCPCKLVLKMYDQRVSLEVGDMSSAGLGVDNISIATQEDAEDAIDAIKKAINTVSATRADLGALQNRLEHTVNNLTTMSENLTSAESTIRDVDMASEMVELTKNQILEQAATSMLAQANAQPQSVLSLLKG